MTLFKKLAGKASALLNASGICSNNCIDGHCSGCGECCADLLPLTKGEIKRLRDYARKHHLQENKRSFLETKGGPDLSCPFRNEHTKQCDVYSVRPLICKEYICSRLLQKPIAQTGLTKEKRDIRYMTTDGQLSLSYAYYGKAVVPDCILNPKSLNLRQNMAYVEEVSE